MMYSRTILGPDAEVLFFDVYREETPKPRLYSADFGFVLPLFYFSGPLSMQGMSVLHLLSEVV